MRIIVVGASSFGKATIRQLLENDHEVVLVDINRDRLDAISDELECGLIHGDGTLPSILREAAGETADVLMMLTDHDERNILGAAVGRSIGFERVIIQMMRLELLPITEELGFDETVTPHETVARSIVASLSKGDETSRDHVLTNELRSVVHDIGPSFDGMRVGELDLPGGARPVARLRGDEEALVSDDTELLEGDRVLFTVERETASELEALFDTEDE